MVELQVGTDGATLAVTFSPAGRTAIVALHGASAGVRRHPLYEHLHAVLPAVGVGVATFDRRGEGGSTGEASRGRFEVQARDALAVAAALPVDRIGLWGFSQGGWVAPIAATMSPDVSFLTLIASTGVSPAEQMRYATAEQTRRAGFGQDAVERALALRHRFEDWVDQPDEETGASLYADLAAVAREPWWVTAFLPRDLPDAAGRARWMAEMDFDPVPVFASVTVPTLLFYGTDDGWTPVDTSIAAWRRARGEGVEVTLIPNASHELTLPDGQLAPAYEDRLVDGDEAPCRAGTRRMKP